MTGTNDTILIIDDNDSSGMVLKTQLNAEGYAVEIAYNGRDGLSNLESGHFDLVLLDLMMPDMSGFDVLKVIRSRKHLSDLPVLIISALADLDSVIKSINLGATDYITKPVTNTILKARVEAALERKRRHDQEKIYLSQLEIERLRSEQLLQNMLPYAVVERLKQGEETIADSFDNVTVLFADIVDFTQLSNQLPPIDLVQQLNEIFSSFDQLADQHGVEKVKTIGDGYMVVGGVPIATPHHATAIADMALDMLQAIQRYTSPSGDPYTMRIGINSGPVVAGVIGRYKFSYDLWGDAVNVAKRMEEQSMAGKIHVSSETYELIKDRYHFVERGPVWVKGRGEMMTYFLSGRKSA